jgi:hypothetical protein
MQPQQQHRAAKFDTSRGFDDIQGTCGESPSSEVAAAAAATAMATAEGHGRDLDEVIEGVEDEDSDEEVETTPHNNNDKANDHGDPEAWRRRIDLRAVECCEAGVQLATPPFPFYQKWDLQDQERRRERKKREKKKRKRAEESGGAGKKRRGSPDYTVGSRAWRSGR